MRLREIADDLEAGSGRIRWCLCLVCPETSTPAIQAGPGFFQLVRDNADPHEMRDAASEVVQRLGDVVIPVS